MGVRRGAYDRKGGAAGPPLSPCFQSTLIKTQILHPPPNPTKPAPGSAVTSEVRYLAADDPTGEFKVVLPRVQVRRRSMPICEGAS